MFMVNEKARAVLLAAVLGLLAVVAPAAPAAATANNPPLPPTIEGPASGSIRDFYAYNITVVDPDGDLMDRLEVDFGDEAVELYECGCSQPRWSSGDVISVTHRWKQAGTYTVRARVADVYGLWSDWSTMEVAMPLGGHHSLWGLAGNLVHRLMHLWSTALFPFFTGGV